MGGSQAFRRAKHRFDIAYLSSRFCFGPTFEPPMPGLYGFGGATCGSEFAERDCTTDEYFKQDFHFSIVDKVEVPSDLAPGEYTLSFRWDSEQTSQVWVSCADVKVKASGLATKPFSPQKGCDICCPEKQLACSKLHRMPDGQDWRLRLLLEPVAGIQPCICTTNYLPRTRDRRWRCTNLDLGDGDAGGLVAGLLEVLGRRVWVQALSTPARGAVCDGVDSFEYGTPCPILPVLVYLVQGLVLICVDNLTTATCARFA